MNDQPTDPHPGLRAVAPPSGELRPGEIQVALPERYDAGLFFIGRIRTPWTERSACPKNSRVSRELGIVCTVELDPRWLPALAGVETCSHLVLLYWMDRARRDLAVQTPRHHPKGKATFSVRSPARPNPIAMAVVELRGVDGFRLDVVGVDCLDDTPLLDIKPYYASTDSIPHAVIG